MKKINDANEKQEEYTYEELFNISKPLPKEFYNEEYYKWNKLNVSTFNSIEQIFYDIAHSKKAHNLYRRINFVCFCFFIFKFLLLFVNIFLIIGLITSKFCYFLMDFNIWKWIILLNSLSYLYLWIIDSIFTSFKPNETYAKIDMSFSNNETGYQKPHWFGFHGVWVELIDNVSRSSYCIYEAHNGKQYLIPIIKSDNGNYYSIRNWYLISKYISCKKMSISDLDPTFEDRLFVFITTKNFIKEKKERKLRCWFSPKFSLNFMDKLDLFLFIFSVVISVISLIVFLSIW